MSLGWLLEAAFLAAGDTIIPIPIYTVLSYCLIVIITGVQVYYSYSSLLRPALKVSVGFSALLCDDHPAMPD